MSSEINFTDLLSKNIQESQKWWIKTKKNMEPIKEKKNIKFIHRLHTHTREKHDILNAIYWKTKKKIIRYCRKKKEILITITRKEKKT